LIRSQGRCVFTNSSCLLFDSPQSTVPFLQGTKNPNSDKQTPILCCLTAALTRDLRSRPLWLTCLRGSLLPLFGPARPWARLCSTSTSRGSPSLFARLLLVASATSGDEGTVTSSSSSSRRHGRSPRCITRPLPPRTLTMLLRRSGLPPLFFAPDICGTSRPT
jgi:hypothetical protein